MSKVLDINIIRSYIQNKLNIEKSIPGLRKIEPENGLTEFVKKFQEPEIEIIFKKQNENKESFWANIAKRGNRVYQVILRAPKYGHKFTYLGVVINKYYLDYSDDVKTIDQLKNGASLIMEKF